MRKFKLIQLIIYVSIMVSGCATQTKSTALGGAIGAGTGAALGGIVDPGKHGEYRTRNVIIGSAVGGIAGAFAGSSLFENNEKKKQEAYENGQKNAKAALTKQGNMPELIVGNRYIDGHFEYIIIEPAHWDVE
jgi:phage tail tape-measure protein